LEELPGATGLRALRIHLADPEKEPATHQKDDLLKDIEDALRLH